MISKKRLTKSLAIKPFYIKTRQSCRDVMYTHIYIQQDGLSTNLSFRKLPENVSVNPERQQTGQAAAMPTNAVALELTQRKNYY